jgi:hypothetical protein
MKRTFWQKFYGPGLSYERWGRTHYALCAFLASTFPALLVAGRIFGSTIQYSFLAAAPVLALAVMALVDYLPHYIRASLVSLGLFLASGQAVRLAHGYTEAHFCFFLAINLVSLYRSYIPIYAGVFYMAIERLVVGILQPTLIYKRPFAIANPWVFAAIFGFFAIANIIVLIYLWYSSEEEYAPHMRGDLSRPDGSGAYPDNPFRYR